MARLQCFCGRVVGVVRTEGPTVTVQLLVDADHCRLEGGWARCTGCGTVVSQVTPEEAGNG